MFSALRCCPIPPPVPICCLSVSVDALRIVSEFIVSESRWPSWAFRPNEPYGFCERKATLDHA